MIAEHLSYDVISEIVMVNKQQYRGLHKEALRMYEATIDSFNPSVCQTRSDQYIFNAKTFASRFV